MYPAGKILFNKYRIEKLLGKGAFGEVYLVTHLGLDTFHALKILTKNVQDVDSRVLSRYRERFLQEAKISARIRHKNIIRVSDVEDQDGVLALVMDYASGGNLSERLAKLSSDIGALPVPLVLSIGEDIALGLSELHRLDIVHRDLKPGNILFDGLGNALIADLGIAQTSDGITSRTIAGDFVPKHPGTPAYMSPEQESDLGYLQPPSDIYSLGLIFFELLTGRNYKNCPRGTRASKIRKDIPKSLDDLIFRCLDPDPKKRLWDGAAVVHELNRIKNSTKKRIYQFITIGTFLGIVMIGIIALKLLGITPPISITNGLTPTTMVVKESVPIPTERLHNTQFSTNSALISTITPTLSTFPTSTITPSILTTKIKTAKAWLRKGPGITHPNIVTETLSKGETVQIISRASDIWFLVRTTNGIDGWLYIEWIENDFSIDAVPYALAIPTPPPPEPTAVPTNSPSNNSSIPTVYPPP